MADEKAQLTIDLDANLHARLKMIAALHRTSMRDYSIEALKRCLAEEPNEPLTAAQSPVLADLWNNQDDAPYDSL